MKQDVPPKLTEGRSALDQDRSESIVGDYLQGRVPQVLTHQVSHAGRGN